MLLEQGTSLVSQGPAPGKNTGMEVQVSVSSDTGTLLFEAYRAHTKMSPLRLQARAEK